MGASTHSVEVIKSNGSRLSGSVTYSAHNDTIEATVDA